MKIGIDIDNTITDTHKTIYNYALKYINENNVHCNYNPGGYMVEEVFGWDRVTANKFLDRYLIDIYENVQPKKKALDVIKHLNKNHQVIIITSRNYHQELIRQSTLNWLKRFGIIYDKLVMNTTDNLHHFSKLASCRENYLDLMIEDHHELSLEISQEIPVLMFDHSYNRHVSAHNIIRIKDWLEVKQYVDNTLNQS